VDGRHLALGARRCALTQSKSSYPDRSAPPAGGQRPWRRQGYNFSKTRPVGHDRATPCRPCATAASGRRDGSAGRLLRVAKSRSRWRGGVVRPLVRPIPFEWPLLKVQRSVVSQDNEWQVPAAAVIGPQEPDRLQSVCSRLPAPSGGPLGRLQASTHRVRSCSGGCLHAVVANFVSALDIASGL